MAKINENQGAKQTERRNQPMNPREAVADTAYDVVCGKGIRPDEAIAQREYKGETYYFCCRGCLEAFDANPDEYVGKEPIRAYKFEEERDLGPDMARVHQAEATLNNYNAQIAEAESRSRAARDNVDRLRRDLDNARTSLNQRRAEMQSLGKREEDIRSGLKGEEDRVANLEAQVARERAELANAEEALDRAKADQQFNLLKLRSDITDLEGRERGIGTDLKLQERAIADLEARVNRMDAEAKDADKRAADLRNAQKAAQDELNRLRSEHREVTLEGLPSTPGEEPAEFYVSRRVVREDKGKEKHGAHS